MADAAEPGPAARPQAAPGDGLRADARAGNPVPRRADLGRGPAGAARVLGPHQRAGATAVSPCMVTTHFMEEAEYCDRLAIMADGRILALGTPEEIKARARTAEHPEPTHGGCVHRADRRQSVQPAAQT